MTNHTYWSPSTRYDQFVVDSYVYLSDNFHQLQTENRISSQFFQEVIAVTRNNKNPLIFFYIALFTVGWTVLRRVFTDYLVKPIAKKYRLPKSEQDKLPECTWNFFYYFTSWLLSTYILFVKEKGVYLQHPELLWSEYQFTEALPTEYVVLYIFELSFYLHSIYAILALDRWRKDSLVVALHHVIAVLLIFFGFSTRGYQTGTVVLFLHDICDVLLEGSKTALYFKTQGKKEYPILEQFANVGFLLFSLAWFCSRLYAFPLRLIWPSIKVQSKVPLLFMLNSMLYLLLMMNLYWFTYILKMLYKVATGTLELKDPREYEEKTEQDDISSDSNEDAIESTRSSQDMLRKRSKVGVRSNLN